MDVYAVNFESPRQFVPPRETSCSKVLFDGETGTEHTVQIMDLSPQEQVLARVLQAVELPKLADVQAVACLTRNGNTSGLIICIGPNVSTITGSKHQIPVLLGGFDLSDEVQIRNAVNNAAIMYSLAVEREMSLLRNISIATVQREGDDCWKQPYLSEPVVVTLVEPDLEVVTRWLTGKEGHVAEMAAILQLMCAGVGMSLRLSVSDMGGADRIRVDGPEEEVAKLLEMFSDLRPVGPV